MIEIKEEIMELEKVIKLIRGYKKHIGDLKTHPDIYLVGQFSYMSYGEKTFDLKFDVDDLIRLILNKVESLETERDERVAHIFKLLEGVCHE